MRYIEVLGPPREDIDFDTCLITVRTRVNRLGKGIGLLVRDGLKPQPERRIAMPRLVSEVLRKSWPRQLEARLAAVEQWKGRAPPPAHPRG